MLFYIRSTIPILFAISTAFDTLLTETFTPWSSKHCTLFSSRYKMRQIIPTSQVGYDVKWDRVDMRLGEKKDILQMYSRLPET